MSKRPPDYHLWTRAEQQAWYEANYPNVVDLAERRQPSSFSEQALAMAFAERHADELRYVGLWGKWLMFTGTRWEPDATMQVFDWARDLCRSAGAKRAKTVRETEWLARSDRRLAATCDQWDADPWLLNTPDGVIDLQSGITHPHEPGDHMTKITAVGPGGDCPRFLKFLAAITAGDVELQAYLQRVLGYSLTGLTREHALFFGYGTGANGKSVLVNTVAGLLGDYHKTSPIETFVASNSDRHPTDLAGLRGARLVTATETEQGRRWAESKIKQLTGGDRVSARFMRQDFFEFSPAFKLVICGNHKPSLRSVDEAIRRRFHLIPFAVTIAPEQRDPDLAEKLKAEWPGILRWMIGGCLDWQAKGLQPPQAVRDATTAYLEAEDAIAAWIEDRCELNPNALTPSNSLFASWNDWAAKAGEHVGTQKEFLAKLETRGFLPKRTNAFRGVIGLRLVVVEPERDWRRDE